MIKLSENKELTEHKAIKKAKLSDKVCIPLIQHFGKPCDKILVKPGDFVNTGQMIATSEGGLFSPVHASISGKVASISDCAHPFLGKAKAVVIESDGKDEGIYNAPRTKEEIGALSAQQIREIVFNAGIVGLGGAGFPTHIKLSPPKPIDTFILNGVECEPYLNVDYRLMLERTNEIISGIKIIIKVLGVERVVIAIEDNKKEAIRQFQKVELPSNWKIKVLKTRYPQGGEKQVIKSCLGKEVPQSKLPFDVGIVVNNIGTVYAVYEAVYKNKPLYEKVVTVVGKSLENSANLEVRLGTSIKELIDQCGPLRQEPAKIVMGGPMMGIAQYDINAPVVKGTSGIILLDKDEVVEVEEEFCLRCGECIANCPIGLEPGLISLAIAKDRLDLAEEYGVMDCIECGLCSYICPANRNLVQSIKYAKQKIEDKKSKKH
ncbi:MAG: electron transport complex subunit RsxC [Candidatus Omnitrophica bacterium]|nr:electron transport complex subunit RsxC [Candidatus Omnitrophota bacterium]